MTIRPLKSLLLLLAGVLCTFPALAQDPPSRVARLNWIQGPVSFEPAGMDTWTSATINYPLTTGDHLFTDQGGRAEMHVDGNVYRLNQNSNFGFLTLDDRTVQARFTEGVLEIRVRHLDDNDSCEIDTPQGAVTLLRNGDYRIDTDPTRNATMVTVRAGEAEVTANGQAFPVHPRQTAFFNGDNPADIRDANPPDDFDRFTADRNRREEVPPRREYVPPSMIGREDLYAYGSWREYPGYGSVWVPPAAAGWAPYRFGHWAWVEPWGWTWIDDAPWGFAPFHYGRWAHVDIGWVWIPGPVAVRPVYAPALVAFVGGPHFSLSVGIGGGAAVGVAWFPLGPAEVYRPVYHTSPTYVNQVNVTNVTNITNVNVTNVNVTNVKYVNQTVPGAVTAVPQNAFVSRQPVGAVAQPVTPQQLANAQVVGTAPAVAPQRASLIGATPQNVPHPSEAAMNRPVVVKATPAPAVVPFAARQQALQRNPGQPLDSAAVQNIRAQQPNVVRQPPVRPAFQNAAQPGMQTPMARPAAAQQAPMATPSPAPNRMDSRPPSARPLPSQNTTGQNQPLREAPQAAPRPMNAQPAARPAEPAPAANVNRPPAPQAAPKPQPRNNEKKEQKREEKREEKKERH